MAEEETAAPVEESGDAAEPKTDGLDELREQMEALTNNLAETKKALAASDRKVTELAAEKEDREKAKMSAEERLAALEEARQREREEKAVIQQLAANGLPVDDATVKAFMDADPIERIQFTANLLKTKSEEAKKSGVDEAKTQLYKEADRTPAEGDAVKPMTPQQFEAAMNEAARKGDMDRVRKLRDQTLDVLAAAQKP